MKKRRILYIGNDLANASFTATYISFFSEVLKQEGYWVKTASNKDNKAIRLVDMLFLIWKHRREAGTVLIDTYATQNFYYAYSIGTLCRQVKLSYIPILHGGNLPQRLVESPKLCRSLFGNAKLNVAPSQFLHDIFKASGCENIDIIPNSIALKNYPFKERQEFGPRLLWVRRFQKHYNPMMAIQVFRGLRQFYPEATLCMVGPEKDGSLSECQAFAEEHGLPVSFPGKLSREDWSELSVDYDFFINTTHIDNTPISVIEAMALGLPVISTDVAGMPFLIDHTRDGILVPDNDADAMISAIRELIEDQEKTRQIAEVARAKVQGFDWEVVKHKWMEVLG